MSRNEKEFAMKIVKINVYRVLYPNGNSAYERISSVREGSKLYGDISDMARRIRRDVSDVRHVRGGETRPVHIDLKPVADIVCLYGEPFCRQIALTDIETDEFWQVFNERSK